MRQGNDLEVVTAPNNDADDEIGQNCKEKNQSFLSRLKTCRLRQQPHPDNPVDGFDFFDIDGLEQIHNGVAKSGVAL